MHHDNTHVTVTTNSHICRYLELSVQEVGGEMNDYLLSAAENP